MSIITSRSNNKVKAARALRNAKVRRESGRFIVEGIRHIGEALESGANIISIFYSAELIKSDFAYSLIDTAKTRIIPCFHTNADVFLSLAEKENPQGIIAIVQQELYLLPEYNSSNFPWGVAIVNPQDPGNIGTILRTIDAVGASGLILLDESVNPYNPSSVRASMGTIFWYPIIKTNYINFSQWIGENNYHVFGTSTHGDILFNQVHNFDPPAILLLGSEREGLSQAYKELCSHLIKLPMHGRASSLNLSVACGILLYDMLCKGIHSIE